MKLLRNLSAAILITLLTGQIAQSQNIQYGVKGGISLYFGDLAPAQNILSSESRLCTGFFVKREFNDVLSIRVDASYLDIYGDDANSVEAWRTNRNLNFQSDVFEGSITAELSPLAIRVGYGNNIQPYIGIGVGIFQFNPTTIYNGNVIELQPLNTEGQGLEGLGTPYSLVQFNIPIQMGVQFNWSSGWNISAELNYRKLFTDYLDDVSGYYVSNTLLSENYGPISALLSDRSEGMINSSGDIPNLSVPRGNPTDYDAYAALVLKVGYTIDRIRTRNGYSRNKIGCPTF
jgi:hypothetical protein